MTATASTGATSLSRATAIGLAALSGVLIFLAFPGWNYHWLAWFAYVPLLIACRDATPWQGMRIGLFAGTITNIGGFHWMTTMLEDFGHMGWLPAWAILLVQAVTQGMAIAIGVAIWRWLARRGVSQGVAAFLGLWTGEVLVPMLFPWHLGNAVSAQLPMIQIADLGGVALVSATLYAGNAAIAELLLAVIGARRPAWGFLLASAVAIALSAGYGLLRIPQVDAAQATAPKMRIGMVEGDIGIWEKEAKHLDPATAELTLQHNLLLHQQLSADLARRGAELIVWPESAFQPSGALPVLHTLDHFLAVGDGGALWRHDGKALHAERGDRLGLPLDLGLLTGLSSPRGDIWRVIDKGRRIFTVTPQGATRVDLPDGETGVTTVFSPEDMWGRLSPGWVVARSGHIWRLGIQGYEQDAVNGTNLPAHPMALQAISTDGVGAFDATAAAVNGSGTLVVVGRGGGMMTVQRGQAERATSPITSDLWTIAGDQQGVMFLAAGAGGAVLQGDGTTWRSVRPTEVDLYAAWFGADGTSWVAGQKGTLLQRRVGTNWQRVTGLPPIDLLAGACDADGNVMVAARGGRLFLAPAGTQAFMELNAGQRGEITAIFGFQPLASFYVPRAAKRIVPARQPLPDPALKFPDDVREDAATPPSARSTPRRGFAPALLLGAMTHGGALPSRSAQCTDCYNSALLLGPDGEVLSIYDKTFLLMFGEYLPFGEQFPQLYALSPETSRFQAGTRTEPVVYGKARMGVLICYEDLIPRFAQRVAAHNPNVFINLTNDAWFGKTAEPEHHLNLALPRTVEYRRWLLRSTNTGISVFIDANGRRVQETSLDGAETMLRDVPLLEEVTVYARLGDWPKLALAVGLLLAWARGAGSSTPTGKRKSAGKKKKAAPAP